MGWFEDLAERIAHTIREAMADDETRQRQHARREAMLKAQTELANHARRQAQEIRKPVGVSRVTDETK